MSCSNLGEGIAGGSTTEVDAVALDCMVDVDGVGDDMDGDVMLVLVKMLEMVFPVDVEAAVGVIVAVVSTPVDIGVKDTLSNTLDIGLDDVTVAAVCAVVVDMGDT